MTYFAEIKNNKVVRVIVCSKEIIKNYSGEWIETNTKGLRKTYAGKNMLYNRSKDEFTPFPIKPRGSGPVIKD